MTIGYARFCPDVDTLAYPMVMALFEAKLLSF